MVPLETTSGYLANERILLVEDAVSICIIMYMFAFVIFFNFLFPFYCIWLELQPFSFRMPVKFPISFSYMCTNYQCHLHVFYAHNEWKGKFCQMSVH